MVSGLMVTINCQNASVAEIGSLRCALLRTTERGKIIFGDGGHAHVSLTKTDAHCTLASFFFTHRKARFYDEFNWIND